MKVKEKCIQTWHASLRRKLRTASESQRLMGLLVSGSGFGTAVGTMLGLGLGQTLDKAILLRLFSPSSLEDLLRDPGMVV